MAEFKPIYFPANTFKYRKTKSLGSIQTQGGQGNEGLDMVEWINDGITEGFINAGSGGGGNLSLGASTATTLGVNIDTGTDVILPAATSSAAGLMTAANQVKLAGLSNYTHPNHSGDVASVGDGTTTIQNGVVNNAKLGTLTGPKFKGRKTAGLGPVEDFTGAEATTLLDIFTDTLKGLVPASGGDADEFLSADGTFKVPVVNSAGVSENGISGTGVSGDKYRLGGTLNQNTIIDGDNTQYIIINDTTGITLEADDAVGTNAKSTLYLTTNLGAGAALRSEINSTGTQYSELRVDPDDTLTAFQRVTGIRKAGLYMPSDQNIYLESNDGAGISKKFRINNTGHFLEGIDTGTKTNVVYIDPTTGELSSAVAPGTGGTISRYDAGNGAYVYATGTGVTYTKSAGAGLFIIPSGVIILSARIIGDLADLASNNLSVTFPLAAANDFPAVTKINTITAAGASTGVPYIYDIDNTPQIQCTSSSTTMTIRALNLAGIGTNWALKFNF